MGDTLDLLIGEDKEAETEKSDVDSPEKSAGGEDQQ